MNTISPEYLDMMKASELAELARAEALRDIANDVHQNAHEQHAVIDAAWEAVADELNVQQSPRGGWLAQFIVRGIFVLAFVATLLVVVVLA